jgi:hypothetical protein
MGALTPRRLALSSVQPAPRARARAFGEHRVREDDFTAPALMFET